MPRYIDVAKQLVRLYRLNLDCEYDDYVNKGDE